MRIRSQKLEFQTASQSEIAFKMANRPKYGDFNFVIEYPTLLSIKRTLSGKLEEDSQNFTQFQEINQKP